MLWGGGRGNGKGREELSDGGLFGRRGYRVKNKKGWGEGGE